MCYINNIKNLNLRKNSYPFDWVTNTEQLNDTNIINNLQIINDLIQYKNIDEIVKTYIGNAFENNKVNSLNNIWFPHDNEEKICVFEKYKRRFIRLKEDVEKKIYILLTRHYYIDESLFKKISDQLTSYNGNSIILFISGTNHSYFDNNKYSNVIFKYIYYDVEKFYNFDYSSFRPKIKEYLSELLL